MKITAINFSLVLPLYAKNIFQDNEKAASFLRVKRSPWSLSEWVGTTDATPASNSAGTGASTGTPVVSTYPPTTTAAETCRKLSNREKAILLKLQVTENQKVQIGRNMHNVRCLESWEAFSDLIEQHEGLDKREEYQELNKCVRKCHRKNIGKWFGHNGCKRATKEFEKSQREFENNRRSTPPKMRQFCPQCVSAVPTSINNEDTKKGVRETVKQTKQILGFVSDSGLFGQKKQADGLVIGGVNVEKVGKSVWNYFTGGENGDGDDLFEGDRVCQGRHEAYDSAFFETYPEWRANDAWDR